MAQSTEILKRYSRIPWENRHRTRIRTAREMYTGDIVALEVDGQVREFVVDKATVDREYNTLQGFTGKDGSNTVKVRLADVVIFRWIDPEGIIHQLVAVRGR